MSAHAENGIIDSSYAAPDDIDWQNGNNENENENDNDNENENDNDNDSDNDNDNGSDNDNDNGDDNENEIENGGSESKSDSDSDKLAQVHRACRDGNVDALARLAISPDGLLSDDIRKKAWPMLLGYADGFEENDTTGPAQPRTDWETLPPHKDEGQVRLDVDRSFVYYPKNMSPRETKERKKELSRIIVEVLRRHPKLCYFQGFHDICQVFLLVLGCDQAVVAMEHIALLRIRDFMLPTLAPAEAHLYLLYPLLKSADPELYNHLSRQTPPFFALAATLTLYAHDIQEYSNIARLFDVFLALDPVFPLYLFAQVVLQRREELFDIPQDEPEMLHSILSKLPKPLDLEGLISGAIGLFEKYPPEKLSTWKALSSKSVLKTSRNHLKKSKVKNKNTRRQKCPDLKQAEKYLCLQTEELERAKRRKEVMQKVMRLRKDVSLKFSRYMTKPQTKAGITVVVGATAIVLGMYLRKGSVAEIFDNMVGHRGYTIMRSVYEILKIKD